MKQVLPCLSAQADDEQAFAAFHKREAERRLNSERKGREKELERQREERAAEEREAAEKRRKWRLRELERAARLRQQMEVAKAEAEAAVALALREQRGDDGEVCSPERMIEIKDILRQLYERFAVEKLSKIDKLLSKYHGREEEFLRFALEKYCPSFLEHMETNAKAKEDAAAEASMEQELQETEELQQLAEAGEEDGEGSSDANAATSSAYHATNRPLVTYSSGSSPTARHLTSTASRVTAAKPARSTFGGRFTRSLSPSHSSADKELKKHWKDSDPGEEEQLKAKVLSQFVPSSEDAWLRYEAAHLLEFTRIYPLPPPLNKDALGEGEKQVMEMGAEDDQEASDDGEAAEETEASGAITISKQQPRFKAASFEDIMVQVFLQDRRQVLRLHGPMALHRSNSVDDGNKASSTTNGARETQSLPPLTSHSNDGSCPLPTTASNTVKQFDTSCYLFLSILSDSWRVSW